VRICGVTDHQLVVEARVRRASPPSLRDLATSSLLAASFLLAAILLAGELPYDRTLSVPSLVALVVGYALVSRVDLEVGTTSAVPVQLVFVPMLFALPLPVVPLAVAAGYVLGALPELLDGEVHPAWGLVLVGRSWFSLGPVLVLSLVAAHGWTWDSAPVYLWALVSLLAFDAASAFLLERVAFGRSPETLFPSFAWIWAVWILLAPIGLVAATTSGKAALFLVLPLAALLDLLAHERRLRIDRELRFGQAYRGALDEAQRDELSGIGNRRRLMADFERFAARDNELVLVVYDLNGFKDYNDAFGHPAGDALLRRLAARLSHAVDPSAGASYRLGGDEFCVLASAGDDVESLLAATVEALAEQGDAFSISTCYGAVFVPTEAKDFSAALSLADSRLYAQKHLSRASRSRPHAFLLDALAERDPDLRAHVHSVSSLSASVGRELGLRPLQVEELKLAAELHDIGKLAMPDDVLQKPGPLTPSERMLMEQHTLIGQRILGAVPALERVAAIVRSTHERWDGTGYADGLAGDSIPLAARIIAVCDAFEAMTSDRPYAARRTTDDALDELARCSGSQFDPTIVEVFAAVLPAHVQFSVAAS
jgi:diguanylate cyclase (GGDEF)-like protein/putative nucleotidyltransferase with HDIG domain